MIVSVLLLFGGGVLYIMLIQLHKARFGGMLPQENFEKNSVFLCVFVYIWIRFCLK